MKFSRARKAWTRPVIVSDCPLVHDSFVGKANFVDQDGKWKSAIGIRRAGLLVRRTVPAKDCELMLDNLLPDLPFARATRYRCWLPASSLDAFGWSRRFCTPRWPTAREAGSDTSFSFVGNLFTSLEIWEQRLTLTNATPNGVACLAHPWRKHRTLPWEKHDTRNSQTCPTPASHVSSPFTPSTPS